MAAPPTVPLAVPDLVTATYLVPLPADAAPGEQGLADQAVHGLRGLRDSSAGDVAAALLDGGLLSVVVSDRDAVPDSMLEGLRGRGPSQDRLDQVAQAQRFVVVSARGRPGVPAVHDWVARGCACVLAAPWDAPVVDTVVPRLLSAAAGLQTLPGPDGKVRLADWVVVPHAQGMRGYWFTTAGLSRFGLPELQTLDVPPQLVRAWGGALTGIAHRVLRVWGQQVRPGADGSPPAFVELPALLTVGAEDVASAYATVAGTGSHVEVALRFDPVSPDEPAFLTVVPPEDYPASAGEYLASVCSALFGANPSTVVYAKGSTAMARAMQRARRDLPGVRRRFLDGDLPRGAHLMVKYPLERGEDREYVWAYVTNWDRPERLSGAAAVDAALDPRVRVGRPVTVAEPDVVDWAIWLDGEGILEGGVTDEVLGGADAEGRTLVSALARSAGAAAGQGLKRLADGVARTRRIAGTWRARRGADAAPEAPLPARDDDAGR